MSSQVGQMKKSLTANHQSGAVVFLFPMAIMLFYVGLVTMYMDNMTTYLGLTLIPTRKVGLEMASQYAIYANDFVQDPSKIVGNDGRVDLTPEIPTGDQYESNGDERSQDSVRGLMFLIAMAITLLGPFTAHNMAHNRDNTLNIALFALVCCVDWGTDIWFRMSIIYTHWPVQLFWAIIQSVVLNTILVEAVMLLAGAYLVNNFGNFTETILSFFGWTINGITNGFKTIINGLFAESDDQEFGYSKRGS